MNATSVTAPRLADSDDLAHVALPIGPGGYFPPRVLITELLADVRELQTVSDRNEVLI